MTEIADDTQALAQVVPLPSSGVIYMALGKPHTYTNLDTGATYWWYDQHPDAAPKTDWKLFAKETPFEQLPGVQVAPYIFDSREALIQVWEQLITGKYQIAGSALEGSE